MSVGSFMIPNSNHSLHCKSPWKISGWASHLLVHCGEAGGGGVRGGILCRCFSGWWLSQTTGKAAVYIRSAGCRPGLTWYSMALFNVPTAGGEGSLANPEQWPRPIQSLRGVLTIWKWKKLSLIWFWEEERCHQVPWFCWAWTKHRLSWRLEYRVRFGPEGDGAQW